MICRLVAIPFFFLVFLFPKGNAQVVDMLEVRRDSALIARIIPELETQLARQVITRDSAAIFFSQLAEKYRQVHDFRRARQLTEQSLGLSRQPENDALIAVNHIRLAQMLMDEDDRAGALRLLEAAHSLYREMADTANMLSTLRLMGNNYDYIGDHTTALDYYEDCLALAERAENMELVAACYSNIAGLYSEEGDQQKAIEIYEKGVVLARSLGNYERLSSLHQGLAIVYGIQKQYDRARAEIAKCLATAQQAGSLLMEGFAYQTYGFHYLALDRLDSSEYYFQITLEIGRQTRNAQLKANAREGLEEIYARTGRYRQAYELSKKIKQEHDSLFNLNNTRLIETMKARYLDEKRERELAEKNLQLEQADNALSRQRIYQFSLLLAVVGLVVIVGLVYRSYLLRNRTNAELQRKNEQIEQQIVHIAHMQEMKNRWFVNVAHELKTPLTLIQGPLKRVLDDPSLGEDHAQSLQLVARNADQLHGLVHEMLDLARMEEGEVTLQESTFDLVQLVSQVLASFESRAEQLKIALSQSVHAPVYVRADREKIFKVLVNLVSNALKFCRAGDLVSVKVEVQKGVKVLVIDTGPGIAPKDLPHIFERFYQSSSQKPSGGTGLGLALSREIAEMHGGQVSATSQPGQGSVFQLWLPQHLRVAAPEVASLPPLPELSDVQGKQLSVTNNLPCLLLVEDNPDMQHYVTSLLEASFQVVAASTGRQGLEQLKRRPIRFIISDVMMPDMDGISFLKEVKASTEWSKLPFIHLSALSDEHLRKEALRIGIDDFLQKPFDADELIIRVKNLYDNYSSRTHREGDTKEALPYDERMVRKLREEVQRNLADHNFNVLRLADGAAMSERQLYRFLKSSTGLTPLQFIHEIRLTRAMELARRRVYQSTGELAAAVGFQRASYFATLFEKRFGKKPTAYLKNE